MASSTAELLLDHAEVPECTWALPKVIPELDGIRGLAILMVLVCHSSSWMQSERWRILLLNGRSGVDLFFVLSGFLITGILLDTRHDHERTRNFYVRRGLRIWPLYFVFLLVAVTAFRWMLPPQPHLWAYLLFIQNFLYWDGTGPFFQPSWSLAVEEQFYALWPWVCFRVRRETVFKICLAVLMFAPIIRFLYRINLSSEELSYVNTFCRLDGIAMGGALAAWVREPIFDVERLKRFAVPALLLGGSGALATLAVREISVICRDLSYSFLAVAFGGMVALAIYCQDHANGYSTFLRQRWLRYLGKVSFALYLFNYPIYVLAHGNHALSLMARLHLNDFASALALLVLENFVLFSAVWVSWNALESPMLKLKSRWAPR